MPYLPVSILIHHHPADTQSTSKTAHQRSRRSSDKERNTDARHHHTCIQHQTQHQAAPLARPNSLVHIAVMVLDDIRGAGQRIVREGARHRVAMDLVVHDVSVHFQLITVRA